MPLTGNWIGYDEMETGKGLKYILASIEYNGTPWERLSTFDEGIIEVASKLKEGDEVTFETKKSGKYTNLTALNGTSATGRPTKASKNIPDRDFKREGRDKAFCGMMNAFIQGYTAHHGEMPEGQAMNMAGARIAVQVMKLEHGEYWEAVKAE